jgi:hypothetical protein
MSNSRNNKGRLTFLILAVSLCSGDFLLATIIHGHPERDGRRSNRRRRSWSRGHARQ